MFNQFTGIGRLSSDPESRFTQSGTQVVNMTVCCEYGWGDNKKVEFVRCVSWDKLAKICADYLHKGSMCMIQGAMQTRQWEDQNGNKRYSTEINLQTMKILSPKSQQEPTQNNNYEPPNTGDIVPF